MIKKDLKGFTYDQILLFLKNIQPEKRAEIRKKIIKYRNQLFIYKRKTKNNKLDGLCLLKDVEGNLIEGRFKNNKLNGKGFYSGSHLLAEALKFNLPPYKLSTPEHIIIIGEFRNDQIYRNTHFFSSNGNFALITSENEKEFKGWIAEEEGSFFSFFDANKSNLPTKADQEGYIAALKSGYKKSFEDYLDVRELVTDDFIKVENLGLKSQLNHRYIIENEKYFKKTGWFPNEICKNKTAFKNKIAKWKKKNEFF